MPEQPSDGTRDVDRGEGVELPDEQAPDADLRAARREIQAVGTSLRDALAADEALAAGVEPLKPEGEVTR